MNPIDKLIHALDSDSDAKAFTALGMLMVGTIVVLRVAIMAACLVIATWPRAGGITFGCAAVWGIVKLYRLVTS